ncbi:MAG: hypothetical protein KKA81_17305 [Bacteroidetes bacterium]|nr:hypothetical protein [Bacteroidota bacterium]
MGSFFKKVVKEVSRPFEKLYEESVRPAKQLIGLFGGGGDDGPAATTTSIAPVTPAPVTPVTEIVLSEAAKQQAANAAESAQIVTETKKKGKKSTLLTGGLGLTEDAVTKKPTILGAVK